MDLKKLFEVTEKYGRVYVFSSDRVSPPACYSCSIEFNTVDHVKLEAKSSHGLPLECALKQAIEKAVLVVESVQGSISSQDIEETKILLEGK